MFIWDEDKNQENKEKHGYYFSEIIELFDDPHLQEFYDILHSSLAEERYISLGFLYNKIICAVTTDKSDGNTRIITAREATRKEMEVYYEHYRREIERD